MNKATPMVLFQPTVILASREPWHFCNVVCTRRINWEEYSQNSESLWSRHNSIPGAPTWEDWTSKMHAHQGKDSWGFQPEQIFFQRVYLSCHKNIQKFTARIHPCTPAVVQQVMAQQDVWTITPPIPTTHVRLHKTGIDQGTPSESQQPAWLIHPPPLSSSNLQLVLSAAVRTDLFLWRKTSCLKKELRLLNTIFCGFNQSVSILSFTQTSEHWGSSGHTLLYSLHFRNSCHNRSPW